MRPVDWYGDNFLSPFNCFLLHQKRLSGTLWAVFCGPNGLDQSESHTVSKGGL